MDVVLLGPPGAGKGTQAKLAVERFGLLHLSTGDMLRRAMSSGSELGQEVKDVVEAGRLVPDETVARVVAARLDEDDAAAGVLFDGFPRTPAQVGALDRILAERGRRVDIAVQLEVDEEEVVQRLSSRRSCREHGPLTPGDDRCATCGQPGEQRADDREEVIRERLRVYREQTAPVSSLYRDRGALLAIDGSGTLDDVAARVAGGLEARGGEKTD